VKANNFKNRINFFFLRKIVKNERRVSMKGGYFAGMLTGGLIVAAAVIMAPYLKPTIDNAMEKGREFIDDRMGKMQK
jgi:ABC-type protease/lipase transport system fused ATPase/permease subunit